MTALDKNANDKVITKTIVVKPAIVSSLGNINQVIYPNKPGDYSIIKVDGENIKEFKAIVYNISGKIVYQWNSIDGFWDGRDQNGQPLERGAYPVKVIAVGEDGKSYNPQVVVTLVK